MWLAVEASASQPPVALLYVGQAVTLLVAVVTGWFALRTKRTDVDEQRRARFDERVDRELDEALSAAVTLRRELDEEHRLRLRYEGWLIRHRISLESGRRETDDG